MNWMAVLISCLVLWATVSPAWVIWGSLGSCSAGSPALLLAEWEGVGGGCGEGVAVVDKASVSSSSAADGTEKVLTSSSA